MNKHRNFQDDLWIHCVLPTNTTNKRLQHNNLDFHAMSQRRSSVSVFWPLNFAQNAPEGKILIAAGCSGNPPAPSLQHHPITSPLWKIIDTPPILQCYPLDNKMFWQITKNWMIPYSIPCRRKTKLIQYWLIVTSKNSRLKLCYIFKFKHSNDQNIYFKLQVTSFF